MAVSAQHDRRGVGALLRALVEESAALVRGEARLAKLEAGRAASAIGRGAALVALGSVLLLLGVLALIVGGILLDRRPVAAGGSLLARRAHRHGPDRRRRGIVGEARTRAPVAVAAGAGRNSGDAQGECVMGETAADVRRDIAMTRERMSTTIAELERKLNVAEIVREHPWAALGARRGRGLSAQRFGARRQSRGCNRCGDQGSKQQTRRGARRHGWLAGRRRTRGARRARHRLGGRARRLRSRRPRRAKRPRISPGFRHVRTDAMAHADASIPQWPRTADTTIPDLVRQLGTDSKQLLSDEVRLAQLEMHEAAHDAARATVLLAIAFGGVVVMSVALTVFVATLVGRVANGHMWIGSFAAALVDFALGALLVKQGIVAFGEPARALSELRAEITCRGARRESRARGRHRRNVTVRSRCQRIDHERRPLELHA